MTAMSTTQMHPDQLSIDEGLVQRLIAAQFPQWADLSVERVPSGGTVNALYRLGDTMVVRLPLVTDAAADLARELEWLPRLAPHLPVTIPHVLAVGESSDDYPAQWAVYRWLDGKNPDPDALSKPAQLATDLGEFVVAMRSVTLPGAPRAHRGGPLALLDEETRSAIEELRGLPEESIDCDAATAAWEQALRAPEWDGLPVWLHADLLPANVLIADGRLTAVIDFGTTGAGDPACDLFPAWTLLPAEARQTFRQVVNVDDATWTRGRGRALSQALIALPYYRVTNPAMAHYARHVIRAVLEEL